MLRQLLLGLLVSTLALSGCTRKNKGGDNTLNMVVVANIKGLDPVGITDTYSSLVASQIYEGLLHYNYLKRPLQLEPLLAAEMPTVSKDGLIHTFKIKPGVKFHNDEAFPEGKGREITAEDFIYSWKRLADPANQSEAYWIFDGRIAGLNEWREKMGKGEVDYSTPVAGLSAPEKHTLVIKLNRPYYQLHYVLAMVTTAVVPKEAIAKYGKEFLNHPVGTGPFKFESWTRNSKVNLTKNPDWNLHTYPTEGAAQDKENGLLADAGQKIPFVDKVVVHEIVEDQPRWLNFMKGELDFVSIPKDNFASAVGADNGVSEELSQKGIRLEITNEPDVTYVAFNMLDPVLGKNENLRKAIAHAQNTQELIKKFYNGRAIRAQSLIPPEIDGYDPNYKDPSLEFNVEKAKEYLKKAGFPEGKGAPELEYAATNSTTARQLAEFFKQNMEAIGLKVKIDSSSWPQFTQKIRDKKAQIWGIAWMADYPDAENFFQLLYGPNMSPGPNSANYKNKEFDALYDKASLLPPGAERTKIYYQLRDILARDLPITVNSHRQAYTTYHGWLKNFKFHNVINDSIKYYRIDTQNRAEAKAKL